MTNKGKILVLIATALIFAAAFVALRIVTTVNYYDVEEGLYSSEAVGVDAINIGLAASCIFFGAAAFTVKPKCRHDKLPDANHGVVFTGALCGFMFISSIILETVYFLPDIMKTSSIASKILFVLSLVFAVFSSLYYFWCASTSFLRKLNYKLLSFCPTLFAVTYTVYMYFDKSTVMNNPERIMMQLSMIMMMLYTVSESRFHLGVAKPRLYLAVSLASVVVISAACVPAFALSAFWMLPFTSSTVYAALQVAFVGYILTRLIALSQFSK